MFGENLFKRNLICPACPFILSLSSPTTAFREPAFQPFEWLQYRIMEIYAAAYQCRIQVVMRLQIAEVMDYVQAVRVKRLWFCCAFSLPRCASAAASLNPLGNLSLGVRARLRRSTSPQFAVDKERAMSQCITPRQSPPLFGPAYYLRKVFFAETRLCKKSTVFFPAPHFTLPSGSV